MSKMARATNHRYSLVPHIVNSNRATNDQNVIRIQSNVHCHLILHEISINSQSTKKYHGNRSNYLNGPREWQKDLNPATRVPQVPRDPQEGGWCKDGDC